VDWSAEASEVLLTCPREFIDEKNTDKTFFARFAARYKETSAAAPPESDDDEYLDAEKEKSAGNQGFWQNASMKTQKGNVRIYRYDMPFSGGKIIVAALAETPRFTQNAYKSMVSALSLIVDDEKIVEYFKENYPQLSGDAQFPGFLIETAEEMDESESEFFGDMADFDFMRLVIFKDELSELRK
jgi:hypothetical protein